MQVRASRGVYDRAPGGILSLEVLFREKCYGRILKSWAAEEMFCLETMEASLCAREASFCYRERQLIANSIAADIKFGESNNRVSPRKLNPVKSNPRLFENARHVILILAPITIR